MTITKILTTALALAAASTVGTTSFAGAGPGALHGSATLVDQSGLVVGTARLVEDENGTLHVNVKAKGLEPGEHGIHIHSVANCTPPFTSAGGHHNPLGSPHGAHAGDLPNITANIAGRGHLNASTEHATLGSGPLSVFDADGSSIVIHAAPDDFTSQPAGNSGARIACGVITGS